MTDRELLELAAKAAGLPHKWNPFWGGFFVQKDDGSWTRDCWNALTDDGDAFRLAIELRIDVLFDGKDSPCAHVETVANLPEVNQQPWAHEPLGDDQNSATRRAIVRAAAEIGRAMG